MQTIENWQQHPNDCKRRLVADLFSRLRLTTHPCTDTINGTDCPCHDSVCAYKDASDELTRVMRLSAEDLAVEQIALLEAANVEGGDDGTS